MDDEVREGVQLHAIAVRGAKLEDFEEFIKTFDKKKEVSEEELHKSNLAILNRKL